MDNDELSYILEDNIRDTFMSVVWSHKIQEKQSDIFSEQYKLLEILRVVCSSLTSVGIFTLIFHDQFWIKISSTLLSLLTIFLNSYFKSFNLQTMISSHKSTAIKLLKKRNELKILLLKVKSSNINNDEILQDYERLQSELFQIYDEAPITSDRAVERARASLNVTMDNSFTDEEIDSNLPESLRRK